MENYPKSINAYILNEWFDSDKENPIIIDVREQSELELASFPKAFIHLPMSMVSIEYVQTQISPLLDREIVVICHAGLRSYNFGKWSLDNALVEEIWNLEEGIDGWSRYIDQTIPRY